MNCHLDLTAVGYRERRLLGCRSLEPIKGFPDPLLVFRTPPQHFAETAIGVAGIPATIKEEKLAGIILVPSAPSTLVFRAPTRKRIDLTLDDLLAWDRFEMVLPDLETVAAPYDLAVASAGDARFTRIEMPWGIDLTPLGRYGRPAQSPVAGASTPNFLWEHSSDQLVSGDWVELWSTGLRNSDRPGRSAGFRGT